jgi:hypothetical protein
MISGDFYTIYSDTRRISDGLHGLYVTFTGLYVISGRFSVASNDLFGLLFSDLYLTFADGGGTSGYLFRMFSLVTSSRPLVSAVISRYLYVTSDVLFVASGGLYAISVDLQSASCDL